jgi:hypothetical protein
MGTRGVPLKKSLLFNPTAGVLLLGTSLLTISLLVTDRTVVNLSGPPDQSCNLYDRGADHGFYRTDAVSP